VDVKEQTKEEQAEEARTNAQQSRAEAERLMQERLSHLDDRRETDGRVELPSESPTTFGSCAAIYHRASLEYAAAAALYEAGHPSEGDTHMSLGAEIEAAGDSCMASASGEIIEV
jgi:hypothetical protein